MKPYRSLVFGFVTLLAICGGVFGWFTRPDISTRVVCARGQVCTEYFNLKDGVTVRAVCPRVGGERCGLRDGCTRVENDCRCDLNSR